MSRIYAKVGKRILDVGLAVPMVVVAAPLMALIAVAIMATMGRPILYRQRRPGLHGEPFTILKFRTMTEEKNADGESLPDGSRLTRLGSLLRRTSLDELPELLNVISGEMSLVGPRPLLMEYLPLYSPRQQRRHDVRPGITGLAQISGRNNLPFEDRFELDLVYVERCSMLTDIRILARTMVTVITGKDVSQDGHATSDRFVR